MNIDNALANCKPVLSLRGGDTGKRGAEHRSIFQLRFTHFRIQVSLKTHSNRRNSRKYGRKCLENPIFFTKTYPMTNSACRMSDLTDSRNASALFVR
jgi:hypothetical protein